MRINLDESAFSDPRFVKLGKLLGFNRYAAIGHVTAVWMRCYTECCPDIPVEDIDTLTEIQGFSQAMVSARLADPTEPVEGQECVRVRGVTDRVEWLHRQRELGRRGGIQRANNRSARPFEANASQGLKASRVRPQAQTSLPLKPSLAPDLALALAPDLAPDHPGDSGPTTSSYPQPHNFDYNPDPVVSDTRPQKIEHSASQTPSGEDENHEPKERNGKRRIPEPPIEAMIASHLLLGYVIKNSPESRIAKAPEKSKELKALSWADDIRLMNERDRIGYPEIEVMIHWSQRHEFWATVILSAQNLRAKWDMMVAQRSRAKGNANQVPQQSKMRQLHEYVTEANARDEAAEKEPIA